MTHDDPRPIRRRRAAPALLVAGLATILGVAGCGTAPSPSPTQSPSPRPTATADPSPADPLEVYATIAGQVAAIRGLEPTAAIEPVVIDEATLRANLETAFDEDNPPEVLAQTERLLRALGLLEPGVSLRDAIIDLNASQVIGYYSSTDDALFVIDRGGALGATARVTYAHEFTHQLQDQHFDLDALGLAEIDESDRSLAVRAFVEGDATLVQTRWMAGNLGPDDLAELLRDATDPDVLAAIERAPRFLVATSLFPYQDGAAFVGAIGGGAFGPVDAAYDRLPTTTEQILHPEKYLAGEIAERPFREPPPTWLSALGPGWSADPADTLGEFMLRFWLTESGIDAAAAADAAAGWNGDRIVLFAGPDDATVVVVLSSWDTIADAQAFASAAQEALAGLGVDSLVASRWGGVSLIFGTDAAAVGRISAQLGSRL